MMTITIPLTELRPKLPKVMDRVSKYFDRYIITRRGKPAAVIMNAGEFEGWLETLEIVSDKKALKELRKTRKELALGQTKTFEEVVGRPQKR